MKVQIAHPSATTQQIEQHLRAVFPRYTVTSRAGYPLVGDGAATGVLVKSNGQGQVDLVWAFPSMAAQIAVTLAIVLTGLLPGLIVFGIVWLVVQSGVGRLKQEVATVLQGGAAPPQAPVVAGAAIGTPPSSTTVIGAVIAFVLAILALLPAIEFGGIGVGLFDALFWIAVGVGALMTHGAQKKNAPSTAGLWIIGVASILHGLFGARFAFASDGIHVVRGILATLLWLGVGGVLCAVAAQKTVDPKKLKGPMIAAGAVLILLAVGTVYDAVMLLDRDVDLIAIVFVLRSILFIALGGVVIARAASLGSAAVAAPPQQQPQYPQQQYAQYPQQQYPQQGQWPPGGNGPR